VAKLALTNPSQLSRVRAISKKNCTSQSKPYSFFLVGSPTMLDRAGKPIIPVTPFTREYERAPNQHFVDAKTGKPYNEATEFYWKTLKKTVEEYIDHPKRNSRTETTLAPCADDT
jgi:hypothetical protein